MPQVDRCQWIVAEAVWWAVYVATYLVTLWSLCLFKSNSVLLHMLFDIEREPDSHIRVGTGGDSNDEFANTKRLPLLVIC